MADHLALEDGTGNVALDDGTGALLLESSAALVASTLQTWAQAVSRHRRRVVWAMTGLMGIIR